VKPIAVVAVVLLSFPRVARAEQPPPEQPLYWSPGHRTTSRLPGEIEDTQIGGRGDGVYGRFDGMFDVGLLAGAEIDEHAPAAAAVATIHYMFTAGLRVAYSDALGDAHATSARTLSLGVDFRPAFIPRWSNALEIGSGFGDLVIDSISLGLGGYFREPPGRAFGDRRGLELSLGFGLPVLAAASGPWLGVRGALRWDDPGAQNARGANALALITFGWHFMVGGS
jgi:hypothetical protein